MRVAILGGGFTGLSAAYYLSQKGHAVTVMEKEPVLGGLAVGFRADSWDWYLERAVHHLFSNDSDILQFSKDIEFERVSFKEPETASLYENKNVILGSEATPGSADSGQARMTGEVNDYRIIPLDSPQDLLRFPYLALPQKVRAGLVLAFLKASPFFSLYEKQTATEFLQKTMGKQAWEVLWKELFRKKFGKYAGNILASFIWARIKKRTKSLGYVEGGFQSLINHTEKTLQKAGITIKTGYTVERIGQKRKGFRVNDEVFDTVISTLPTPILARLGQDLLPPSYIGQIKKIEYQHAISLILETKEPFLKKAYWLNMCVADNPIMGLFQHTNFIDKKHYGGNHILYVGNYVEVNDPRLKLNDKEILDWYAPHLKKINPNYQLPTTNYHVFKAPFAQPIFDKVFVQNKPEFETPIERFYVANLDMTYPYDRGTNYAIKLGREVSKFI